MCCFVTEKGTVVTTNHLDVEKTGFASALSFSIKACDGDQRCTVIPVATYIRGINDNSPFCDQYLIRWADNRQKQELRLGREKEGLLYLSAHYDMWLIKFNLGYSEMFLTNSLVVLLWLKVEFPRSESEIWGFNGSTSVINRSPTVLLCKMACQ